MSVITEVPDVNMWEDICKAMAAQRPPFKDDDAVSVHTVYEDFDPARHNPVFYGKMHKKIESVDCDPDKECDPSTCHPSLAGYTLLDKPPKSPTPPPPALPDVKKCLPRVYLDTYIFPVLLPALEEMLRQAKLEKCFERKRTKFNGLDFLTEYLYGHNSSHADREETPLGEIPFVKEHWKDHPRPPLPKSLIWTEAEAVLILQSFWRGYKVRCDPQIQELRQWQREWREENADIQNKVSDFWAKKMPDGDEAEEEEEEEEDIEASPRDGENDVSPREGENQSQDVGETEETSNPGQDVEEA